MIHAVAHFLGGFIGKGNRQDVPRRDAFFNEVSNTGRDHPGFAASGPSEDQDRSLGLKDRFLLQGPAVQGNRFLSIV